MISESDRPPADMQDVHYHLWSMRWQHRTAFAADVALDDRWRGACERCIAELERVGIDPSADPPLWWKGSDVPGAEHEAAMLVLAQIVEMICGTLHGAMKIDGYLPGSEVQSTLVWVDYYAIQYLCEAGWIQDITCRNPIGRWIEGNWLRYPFDLTDEEVRKREYLRRWRPAIRARERMTRRWWAIQTSWIEFLYGVRHVK